MEKDLKTKNIEIVQSNQGDIVLFQLKEPKAVNETILSELEQEISSPRENSVIIYLDQRIIESNQVFIEDTHLL